MKVDTTLRTCEQGHQYRESSDCPTCPVCEEARKPDSGWLSRLSSPARNALEHAGITTTEQLSAHSEKEILKLHGMGPASLPRLREALQDSGLAFRK